MVVPERWQEVIALLLAPVAWVPRMQEAKGDGALLLNACFLGIQLGQAVAGFGM